MPSAATLAARDQEYGSQIVDALNARECARCDLDKAQASGQGVAAAKTAYDAADQAVKDFYTRFYAEDAVPVASAAPRATDPRVALNRHHGGVQVARNYKPSRSRIA